MTIKHLAGLALFAIAAAAVAADFKVLQPLADKPMKQKDGSLTKVNYDNVGAEAAAGGSSK